MSSAAPSLQRRLLWLVLGLVTAVWLGAALRTWFDTRHELDELLDGHLAQAAALLVVQQLGGPDDDAPTVDAPQLHRQAPKIAFQVFHEGRLVLRSANAPVAPMVAPGEHFRSGCVWQIGKGRVFYFRPGHETFSIYLQREPLQVITNGVRWLAAKRTN